jgi:hypothetical protein
MIIDVYASRSTLLDPYDFKSFKIVAPNGATIAGIQEMLGDIAHVVDLKTVWVTRTGLDKLTDARSDPVWRRGVEAMIEKARAYGWINEAGAIRAHVEFRQ